RAIFSNEPLNFNPLTDDDNETSAGILLSKLHRYANKKMFRELDRVNGGLHFYRLEFTALWSLKTLTRSPSSQSSRKES
ncbi:hypothetical protein AVEN_155612-1, partial [Araneus ventricosus]